MSRSVTSVNYKLQDAVLKIDMALWWILCTVGVKMLASSGPMDEADLAWPRLRTPGAIA